MRSLLTLLTSPESIAPDNVLRNLATFIGVSCQTLDFNCFCWRESTLGRSVIAVHAHTLCRALNQATSGRLAILQQAAAVLVYGFSPCRQHEELLKILTCGAVSGVRPMQRGKRRYEFSESLQGGGSPLAGMSCELEESRESVAFVHSEDGARLTHLVCANEGPVLIAQREGTAELFLLAYGDLPDLDREIGSSASVREVYTAVVPAVLFLRTVFPDACWTNPFPSGSVIIDDPLIRPRYGCLEYEALLAEARRHGYSVTLAFIPFNHARSDRQTARFLHDHLDHFSLAVHGCDHTENEFGRDDEALLTHKARLAIVRMQQHQRSSALPFDPVMVFPQGLYSTTALRALKRSGYCAAVNTDPTPVDADRKPLTVRHLLDGAVTAYHSFPLFLRHYPRSLFDFAVDLLLGKPAFIVEHHGYFKHGYAPLTSFVSQVQRLVQGLTWLPLGTALTSHALYRSVATGHFAVRFFTSRFHLRNPTGSRSVFALSKSETEPDLVSGVTLDGHPVSFTQQSDTLACAVELPPHGQCEVAVTYRDTPQPHHAFSMGYRCSAAARRYMSEFRDNYLSRSESLSSLASRLMTVARRVRGRSGKRGA